MKNNVIAGILSGLIAGAGVLIIDKILLPDGSEITLQKTGITIVSLVIGFCISLLFKVLLTKKSENSSSIPSLKSIFISSLAVLFLLIYQIYPSFYYKKITDSVIKELTSLEKKHKEPILQIINQEMIDTINPMSHSSLEASSLTKRAMKKNYFLSLLAVIHPSIHTAPMMTKSFVFLNIKANYRNDGIYLENTHSRNIKITDKFNYKTDRSYEVILLSIDNAKDIYNTKYGNKNHNGGTVCPINDNYLRTLLRGNCEPATNKVLLKFLSKPKDELWQLLLSSDYPRLISPQKNLS